MVRRKGLQRLPNGLPFDSHSPESRMTADLSPQTLAAEFDMFMARAGIEVPADRRDGLLAGFADLRSQVALLHGRLDATVEPANVFRLSPLEA